MIAPGLALTLWASGGLEEAFDQGGAELLPILRPDVVQMHTFPATCVVHGAEVHARWARLHRHLPGVRSWLGLGVDHWTREWRDGVPAARIVAEAVRCAELAETMGAEAIVWNAEGGWKGTTAAERQGLNDLARGIVDAVAARVPALVQAHTSFDHPSMHSTYAWRGWIGPGTPVRLALPQVYAAPGKGAIPHVPGRGPHRAATSLASWREAIRKGWIADDVEGVDVPDDLDWMPYVQGHSVYWGDTTDLLTDRALACAWACPTRLDGHGLLALALARSQRDWHDVGPDATERMQRLIGVPADGKLGPATLRTLLTVRGHLSDAVRALCALEHRDLRKPVEQLREIVAGAGVALPR